MRKCRRRRLPEFVALAKKEPGKFNYSSPGAAGQNHLVTALFSQRAGITLQHVPYRGGAPAILSLVAGDTHFAVISPLAALPHIKSGTVRALAAGGLARDTQFPDLPTVAESGYPGFEAIQWVGMLTTGGTPKPIVDRLNAEVNKALRDPATAAALRAARRHASPAAARRISQADRERIPQLGRGRPRGQHQGGVATPSACGHPTAQQPTHQFHG